MYNSGKKGYSWSFNKNREEYIIGGNDKIPPFTIPSSLFNKLYDFQKDGVAWLATLYLKRIGGILGDDFIQYDDDDDDNSYLNRTIILIFYFSHNLLCVLFM